jgi:general secretion pathway protein G
MSTHDSRGFTLIELLIVIVVLGLLATIALPAYQSYKLRLQDGQAVRDISEISMRLERWHTENYQYPPDLATLGAVQNDPWGNPYQYLNIEVGVPKGKVRKDKNINPLNRDFDLYSMGPDGKTSLPLTAKNSHDDIVRAGDGSFIGVATDY